MSAAPVVWLLDLARIAELRAKARETEQAAERYRTSAPGLVSRLTGNAAALRAQADWETAVMRQHQKNRTQAHHDAV